MTRGADASGWSQPFVDRGDEDGGLEADRELVEPGGHRPVALEPVDSALDRVPGLVVQKNLARQLKSLPWKQIPVLHRTSERGHGREEIRAVQVASVNGLLFPHACQVVRIRRRRRSLAEKKSTGEIVCAVTDLPAEQASAGDIASWARDHWKIENCVHWIRDVVFGEDARTIRTRNTSAVMVSLGDIVRRTVRALGWVNTASARRAHTDPATVLQLHGIT